MHIIIRSRRFVFLCNHNNIIMCIVLCGARYDIVCWQLGYKLFCCSLQALKSNTTVWYTYMYIIFMYYLIDVRLKISSTIIIIIISVWRVKSKPLYERLFVVDSNRACASFLFSTHTRAVFLEFFFSFCEPRKSNIYSYRTVYSPRRRIYARDACYSLYNYYAYLPTIYYNNTYSV